MTISVELQYHLLERRRNMHVQLNLNSYTLQTPDPIVAPISPGATLLPYFAIALWFFCQNLAADSLDAWYLRNPSDAIWADSAAYGKGKFVLAGGGIWTSSDTENWMPRDPDGHGVSAITYANDLFVAVGWEGGIVTSSDGLHWTSRVSGTTNHLFAVARGQTEFIAVGEKGVVVKSSDGVNWTRRTAGTDGDLYGISYGNGIFVAVGQDYRIMSSNDGVNWITRNVGKADPNRPTFPDILGRWGLTSVAFGNGGFIAVGNGDAMASFDGINWSIRTQRDAQSPFPNSQLSGLSAISYGEGRFFAVGSNVILASGDGFTWTTALRMRQDFPQDQFDSTRPSFLKAIAFGDRTLLAAGENGTILSSSDALNWKLIGAKAPENLWRVQFGNDRFVSIEAAKGRIHVSSDGRNWTSHIFRDVTSIGLLAYGTGVFVAIGGNDRGPNILIASTNGIIWTEPTLPRFASPGSLVSLGGTFFAGNLRSQDGINWTENSQSDAFPVAYGDGRFIAYGSERGTILSSTNGSNWQVLVSGKPEYTDNIRKTTFGNGRFVAVGNEGLVLSSTTGQNWTQQNLPDAGNFNDLAYARNLFVAVSDRGAIYTSPDGVNWSQPLPPTEEPLKSVSFGNGKFLAVGRRIVSSEDGQVWKREGVEIDRFAGLKSVTHFNGNYVAIGSTIATSADGRKWIDPNSGFGRSLGIDRIIYANGRFVGVGTSGSEAVAASTSDGIDWRVENRLPSDSLSEVLILPAGGSLRSDAIRDVAYGNGQFVALPGKPGRILAWTDGHPWVLRDSGVTNHLNRVAYGSGVFVAVGESGAILTSSNGIEWTRRNSGTSVTLGLIAFGNGQFVAIGEGGKILQSRNGISWITVSDVSPVESIQDLAFGNGLFVLVGNGGSFTKEKGQIAMSSNGTDWVTRYSAITPDFEGNLNAVSGGNGIFLAVGGRNNGTVVSSADGITWTDQRPRLSFSLKSIAFGSGKFLAVADNANYLYSSSDGTSWTGRDFQNYWSSITQGNGRLVGVGNDGKVMSSADGISWVVSDSGTANHLSDVTYGADIFAAVGGRHGNGIAAMGTIITSTNTINWTISTVTNALFGVAFGNGRFVAVGLTGTYSFSPDGSLTDNTVGAILSSTDGMTWFPSPSGTTNWLTDVAYGNGQFVAVGDLGTVLTSANGLNWTPRHLGTSRDSSLVEIGVAYGAGNFVALGKDYLNGQKVLLTSQDGVAWTLRNSPWLLDVKRVDFVNGTFVAIAGATILQSGVVASTADNQPPFLSLIRHPLGTVDIDLHAATGSRWFIEASTNLAEWQLLTNVLGSGASVRITDQQAINFRSRYYRARSQ